MLAAVISMSAEYWRRIRDWAVAAGSDGCTKVADFYVDCCFEHDLHYILGRTLTGESLSKTDADRLFRLCIQERSPFGVFSPMSWWRWLGVRLFGRGKWK